MRELLRFIPADAPYDDWFQALAAVHHECGGSADGLALVDAWSAQGSKYRGTADVEQHWKSLARGKGITGASLAQLARSNGANLSEIALRNRGGSRSKPRSVEAEQDGVTKAVDESPLPFTRPLPAADPFPLDALGPLKSSALAIQAATQAPIALCANSVIATAALAGQAHVGVLLPTGRPVPISVFILTIAKSGERKSTVDGIAVQPVRLREEILRKAHAAQIVECLARRKAWEAQGRLISNDKKLDFITQARKLAALGPEPSLPLHPSLIIQDPTIEGLLKFMKDGHPSLAIISAEGGAFFGGHAMAEDTKLRTAAILSLLWDAAAVAQFRAGDGARILEGRRLTTHLQAQPDIAMQFVNDAMLSGQGFIPRFLISAPDSTQGTRFWQETGAGHNYAIEDYYQKITKLLSTPAPLRPGTRNELEPRQLVLSPEARVLWITFSDEIERRVGPDGDLAPISGFAAKLLEHASRLAGILTIYEDIDAKEINQEAMRQGFELATYYGQTALRLRNAAHVNIGLREAEQLSSWLSEKWDEDLISVTDLVQFGPNSVRDTAKARRLIDVLEKHHHLVRRERPGMVKGKMRREVWEIRR